MKRLHIGLLLLLPTIVTAQNATDSLQREVTIEKDFTPIVRDASKINVLPEVEPLTTTKRDITYSDWAVPASLASAGAWLPPAGFSSANQSSNYRGYADVGMGTYWNTIGNIGYRILQNKQDRLNVWAQHRSTNGTVRYNQKPADYPRKRKMRQLSDQIVADYVHSFEKADLGIRGGYRYDNFNYYGLCAPHLLQSYAVGQQVNRFFLKSDIASTTPKAEMDYKASLSYHHMGFEKGYQQGDLAMSENELRADFALRAPIDTTQAISLNGEFAYLNYSRKKASSINYAMLSLIPKYDWTYKNIALSAGLRVDISFNDDAIFRFAPEVNFDWHITKGMDFFTTIVGGKTLNTWRRVSGYTLYFNPSQPIANTYTPIDVSLGLRTNLLPGFSAGISAGYELSKNALFAFPELLDNDLTGITRFADIDAQALKASVNATYRYGSMFEAQAKVDYRHWISTHQGITISYDQPRWAGNINLRYLPIEPLSLEAGYEFATGRNFFNFGKLKDKHLLHLKAAYQFTPWLSAYALSENLLNCKYDILYGIPAQGIRFMAGVDIKF